MLLLFDLNEGKLVFADDEAQRIFLTEESFELNSAIFAELNSGREEVIFPVGELGIPIIENADGPTEFKCSFARTGKNRLLKIEPGYENYGLSKGFDQAEDFLEKLYGSALATEGQFLPEKKLLVSEKTIATIFEAAVDGIIIINEDGTILGFNKAAEKIFLLSAPEVIGKSVTILMPEPHKSKHDAYVKRYLDTGIAHIIGIGRKVDAVRANGEIFPIDLAVAEVKLGESKIFAGFVKDITEQRKMLEDLNHAREEAERSSEARGLFIARMSHELRTPLNSIIGFSGILQKNLNGGLKEKDLLYLDRIRRNGHSLLKLINSLLEFSKTTAGFQEIFAEEINLLDLIREIVDLMQVTLDEKRVQVNLELPECEIKVKTDAIKLRQIIQNLVDNAVKYSAGGSVDVALKIGPDNKLPVILEVRDTGPGIPPEHLDLIFEAFHQCDNSVTRKFGGAGLGLAIASSFAKLLGFQIKVDSVVGQGSCFSLVFDSMKGSRFEQAR